MGKIDIRYASTTARFLIPNMVAFLLLSLCPCQVQHRQPLECSTKTKLRTLTDGKAFTMLWLSTASHFLHFHLTLIRHIPFSCKWVKSMRGRSLIFVAYLQACDHITGGTYLGHLQRGLSSKGALYILSPCTT
ncbi:hypothetical protein B0O99DRAFT_633674 [Bisporella sp. PMI_857]|nr:hypothetical protein B0O99DRAFT_633674 [Bisporella sp. PMI_857]